MLIHCISLFTIAICICCLCTSRFLLIKKKKKRTRIRITMLVIFLIFQLINVALLEDMIINKNVIYGCSSLLMCFIIIENFNKQKVFKKQLLGLYNFEYIGFNFKCEQLKILYR